MRTRERLAREVTAMKRRSRPSVLFALTAATVALAWSFVGVLAVLTGCASMSKVESRHDDFGNYTTHRMTMNFLSGPSKYLVLNAWMQEDADGTTQYCLNVVYESPDWLFIESGESLHLLVDGEALHLTTDGGPVQREVVQKFGVVLTRESALYPAEPELLQKIAAAKEVRVKVEGSHYYVERRFTKTNFANFREYVAKYVSAERPASESP